MTALLSGLSRQAYNALFILSVMAVFAGYGSAHAAATVGDALEASFYDGYAPFVSFATWAAFIAGCAVVVMGGMKLKNHVSKPDQVPLSHGLWHLAGGGLLVSMPALAGILQNTFMLQGTGLTEGATSFALEGAGSGLTLDGMMINLINNIRGPMYLVLASLGGALGVFFLSTGLMRMSKGGGQDGPRGSMGSGTLGRIIIGSILISLASTTDMITNTLFSGGLVQFEGLNIDGLDSATLANATNAMGAVLVFIQIIGGIAFMRGFLMLRALADGSSSVSTSAAFTHILGGSAALNISPVLNMIQNTMCGSAGCDIMGFT